MKIGIFGGTFNPIHEGHLKVAKSVHDQMGLDLILMIPTYKTPGNKFDPERIDSMHRYNMVVAAVEETKWAWLQVSDIEVKSHQLSYTYLTVEKLQRKYPKDELFFIMGDDQFKGFKSWRNPDLICDMADLIIYKRGKGLKKIPHQEGIHLLGEETFDVSSTEILTKLEWDKIPPATRKYIAKHRLYLKTLAFKLLKQERYQHAIATAVNAKRLAKLNHYSNGKKAYDAGLAHDLFKLYSNRYLLEFYNQHSAQYLIPPVKALHGYCVALWLEQEYGLKDQEFLNAVRRHTIPSVDEGLLDKIIYVADKTSMDRKGDDIFVLRKLAYSNLDLTFEKIFKASTMRLIAHDVPLDKETQAAYTKFFNIKSKDQEYGTLKKLN